MAIENTLSDAAYRYEKHIEELKQLVRDMYKILKQEDIDGRMFARDGKVVFERWDDRLHELGIEVNK